MLNKVGFSIEKNAFNTIVTKQFQRNAEHITTRKAYNNNILYYQEWVIRTYNKLKKYMVSYNNGIPCKGSFCKLDYEA